MVSAAVWAHADGKTGGLASARHRIRQGFIAANGDRWMAVFLEIITTRRFSQVLLSNDSSDQQQPLQAVALERSHHR
jgi:hypothetical protein